MTITVTRADGRREVHDANAADVRSGYLWLHDPEIAVYAPGAWLSAREGEPQDAQETAQAGAGGDETPSAGVSDTRGISEPQCGAERLPEPMTRGAIVRFADGTIAVRADDDGTPWRATKTGQLFGHWGTWDHLTRAYGPRRRRLGAPRRLGGGGTVTAPDPRESQAMAEAIRSVTDLWDEPLDEVRDVPQVVNALIAAGWHR